MALTGAQLSGNITPSSYGVPAGKTPRFVQDLPKTIQSLTRVEWGRAGLDVRTHRMLTEQFRRPMLYETRSAWHHSATPTERDAVRERMHRNANTLFTQIPGLQGYRSAAHYLLTDVRLSNAASGLIPSIPDLWHEAVVDHHSTVGPPRLEPSPPEELLYAAAMNLRLHTALGNEELRNMWQYRLARHTAELSRAGVITALPAAIFELRFVGAMNHGHHRFAQLLSDAQRAHPAAALYGQLAAAAEFVEAQNSWNYAVAHAAHTDLRTRLTDSERARNAVGLLKQFFSARTLRHNGERGQLFWQPDLELVANLGQLQRAITTLSRPDYTKRMHHFHPTVPPAIAEEPNYGT